MRNLHIVPLSSHCLQMITVDLNTIEDLQEGIYTYTGNNFLNFTAFIPYTLSLSNQKNQLLAHYIMPRVNFFCLSNFKSDCVGIGLWPNYFVHVIVTPAFIFAAASYLFESLLCTERQFPTQPQRWEKRPLDYIIYVHVWGSNAQKVLGILYKKTW